MPDNLNEMNQLQTADEATANSNNEVSQSSEPEALTVEQLKVAEAIQVAQNNKKLSPTQPITPAVITALYSGNNQEKPLFSRDKQGIMRGNLANLAYKTGPAKSYVTPEGELEVVGRREALAKDSAEVQRKINDYAAVAYPEFLKDYAGRSGFLTNVIADVGTLTMSAPRGFATVPANMIGTVMSAGRYSAEAKWQSFHSGLSQDLKDNVASFIKIQIEEADAAQEAHAKNGNEEFGDSMYASAQERIFSPDVQTEYGLSEEEKQALQEYKKVVEARDADMRRSLFIKEFSEEFGKEGQEALYNLLDLTEDDKNSLALRLSESGGELAGNLAFFYMTGRAAGSMVKTAGSVKNALQGKGYLNYARAVQNGKVTLASNAAVPAGFAARMAFQEASVIPTVFASQFNQIRTEALLSGKSLNEATSIALAAAAAESGLEFAGFKIFKRFYTDGGWMRNVLWRNILPEGLQEASQTIAENIITETAGVTSKQWTDIMSEIGFSLMAGMIGGAAFSAGRMRFEGFMAQVEDLADTYSHSLALLTSSKAKQAYEIAMDELAFEEWLEDHPEVDQKTIEEKRSQRAANKAQSQQIEDDVKQAKEDIKSMYRELRAYFEAEAKKRNPDIKKKQLQVGWDMIKMQIGIALDGNTLTSKYYAAADHVIKMYYDKLPQINKYQTREIAKMLKGSGKYTKEQIKALTSTDHVTATNAKLDRLESLLSDNLIEQGIGEADARLSARVTRQFIAPSALINPNFDAVAMAKKLRTNVLHIRNASFYKMPELEGTPFDPISNKFQQFPAGHTVASVSSEKDMMTALSKLLFSQSDLNEQDSAKYNKILYGQEDFDPGLKRTKALLLSQAPLTRQVIEKMPTKLTRDISDEEAGAMWLLNNRGMSWQDIFNKFDIPMKGNRIADNFFMKTAKDIVPKPKAIDMKRLQRMLNRINSEEQNEAEMQRMQGAEGLYDPTENLMVLNVNAKPGTAFHEHNHFSMYALLNNQLKLDELGLLPDTSLLQPLKDKLAKKMQGAKWLTEREFQETLNAALFEYLDSGKCKDPILTSYFAILKSQGYQNRVDLYASRLSKSSESALDKTQKKELMKTVDEVFGSASISSIITKANQVREHVALKGLPERQENEGIRMHHEQIANLLANELQDLLNSVPIKDADEFSRQIELARNEDMAAPTEQEVINPGYYTDKQTITNKGNITKLLILGEQISAKALDFAYDVITTEKSASEALMQDGIPMYNAAADVISPNRQPQVVSLKEVTESLKALTPSWESFVAVRDGVVNVLKDLMYSLEGSAGEMSNELRDMIMREIWNESSYRNLFRSQLRPLIDAKNEWLGNSWEPDFKQKNREFQRQVTANLGDGNFTAARNWIQEKWGKQAAQALDNILMILHGNTEKAEAWMKLSPEERKNNPIGYLYKGAVAILAESGMSVDGVLINYFPMLVKDFKGLTKRRFGHAYTYSQVDKIKARLREEYLKKTKNIDPNTKKPYLTPEENKVLDLEVAELVNSRMQRNVTDEDKVASFFKRRFRNYGELMDKEEKSNMQVSVLDYYFDPFESLDRYMDAVLRTATARHLIGHTAQLKNGKPLFTHMKSVKEAVAKIRNRKDLTAEEKTARINGLVNSNGKVGLYLATHDFGSDPTVVNRFMKAMHAYVSRNSSDPDDFFNWMRSVNQLTMLGSIFSTLNQVNDLQYCFTLFGMKATGKAISDVFFNHDSKEVIKLEDIGGESANEAYRPSDETHINKLTRWVFQHTGFEWADVRLKEVTVNAFNNYAKDVATQMLKSAKEIEETGQIQTKLDPKWAEDIRRFDEMIEEVIPDTTKNIALSEEQAERYEEERKDKRRKLLEDLAAGKQTQDTKYFQWYMLTKMQPMNSAVVSAHYNSTNSFGRLCWQFNTVSSRQAGFLREYYMKEKAFGGPLQAAKAMAKFVLAAWLVGIPKEILEAFLKGQKPEAIDLATTPLQAMWLNQYTMSTLKRQGLAAGAFAQFSPKAGFVNNMSKDIFGIMQLKPKGYTTRNIPIIGPFVWYWLAGGRTAAIRQDKALFHHKMTKSEYDVKVAEAKQNANYMKTGEEEE